MELDTSSQLLHSFLGSLKLKFAFVVVQQLQRLTIDTEIADVVKQYTANVLHGFLTVSLESISGIHTDITIAMKLGILDVADHEVDKRFFLKAIRLNTP